MKVIMYMAISINGFIAREDGKTDWPSPEDWDGFENTARRCGNLILGRNTFQQAVDDKEFPFFGVVNVVMSHKKIKNEWGDKVIITENSPQWVITKLEELGFKEAFVGGGGEINKSFLKEGLVDEIYLDVEPIVFGRGIPLFAEDDFEASLELIGTKKLNKNTVQLHYKVKR